MAGLHRSAVAAAIAMLLVLVQSVASGASVFLEMPSCRIAFDLAGLLLRCTLQTAGQRLRPPTPRARLPPRSQAV